ncbi:hypothetical protein BD779DRAFT_1677684 [Infundibulicybe gibba]|nr:hypothetical protein BD779DRAFT_1677684 [Infundibulicybe gibba]
MRFTTVAASLSLAALAVAQSNNSVTIEVGSTESAQGGIFQFIPPSVNATNGTVITFRFSGAPGNHSITQSTFTDPCNPAPGGFDSGWVFLNTPVTPVPEWNLTITDDSKPIWFFCKQLVPAPHCPVGMVGAINAPASGANTFSAFQSNAHAASGSGQGIGALVGQGASASAPPGPIPSDATLFGTPAATAAAGSGAATGSGAAPASSSTAASGAATLIMSPIGLAIAALLGVTLA